MAASQPNSSARRSRAYRERMRAAGYRAAEVWRLDTTDAEVRARIERQIRQLSRQSNDTDWTVE
ncbi:MAG: antitoxin MazE-like protein, partial [Wenzhouxiangella sp.]